MDKLKKHREPTFTASEKFLLIELVEKHFEVVENKKTDSVSSGGPLKPIKDDPIIDRVIPLIRPRAEGLRHNYDSDAFTTSTESTGGASSSSGNSSADASDNQIIELMVDVDCDDTVQDTSPLPSMKLVNGDWGSYSPGQDSGGHYPKSCWCGIYVVNHININRINHTGG